MTTKFSMNRDINGYNSFGLPFTDTNYSATLAASTDTTLVVPAITSLGNQGYSVEHECLAIFSYDPGSSVWVANNAVASAPAGASFASTSSELNPSARVVNAGDTLHFFSTGTNVNVDVSFYSLV